MKPALSLAAAVVPDPAVTKAPCDGCRHAKRCASEQLGCDALVLYKRVSTSPIRWQRAPRSPSKALYELAHTSVKVRPRRQSPQVELEFDETDGDDGES